MQPKPEPGISGKARETLAKILDHVLQDECSLSATTRDYRWKLTGPNLYSLHRLFDEQRRQLDFWLDKVIERTKSTGISLRGMVLDREAPGEMAASGTSLPPGTIISDLLARHEELAHRLHDDVTRLNDPVTAELLQRLAEFHETAAWMLRMLEQGPDPDRAA